MPLTVSASTTIRDHRGERWSVGVANNTSASGSFNVFAVCVSLA